MESITPVNLDTATVAPTGTEPTGELVTQADTEREAKRKLELAEREETIERNRQNIGERYLEIGRELRAIRDKSLYSERYPYDLDDDTFAKYCARRWNLSRSHAYRLMDAASVHDVLSPTGDTAKMLPTSFAILRELIPLKDDRKALAAMGKRLEQCQDRGERITGATVHREVERVRKYQRARGYRSPYRPPKRQEHGTIPTVPPPENEPEFEPIPADDVPHLDQIDRLVCNACGSHDVVCARCNSPLVCPDCDSRAAL